VSLYAALAGFSIALLDGRLSAYPVLRLLKAVVASLTLENCCMFRLMVVVISSPVVLCITTESVAPLLPFSSTFELTIVSPKKAGLTLSFKCALAYVTALYCVLFP